MMRNDRVRAAARWLLGLGAALVLALPAAPSWADAARVRARYGELRDELRNNPFGHALHVDSAENGNQLQGDIYAVLDHPFERVSQALKEPGAWCDIMILPFNTKSCNAVDDGGAQRLVVRIGRKYNQPVEQAYRLDFAFRNVAAGSDYFESRLAAREGPLGTRDYNIRMAAVPLGPDRTFMHLNYTYGFGTAGRIAMQAYLATVGADKVGFTVTGRQPNGAPQFIGGVRGAVERNAMRYYLAVDAYLESVTAPAERQVEKRIQGWFAATERYPRQLHEMDRATYVAMKRQEVERQEAMALR